MQRANTHTESCHKCAHYCSTQSVIYGDSNSNLKTLKIKLINCEQILKSRHATLSQSQAGPESKDASACLCAASAFVTLSLLLLLLLQSHFRKQSKRRSRRIEHIQSKWPNGHKKDQCTAAAADQDAAPNDTKHTQAVLNGKSMALAADAAGNEKKIPF